MKNIILLFVLSLFIYESIAVKHKSRHKRKTEMIKEEPPAATAAAAKPAGETGKTDEKVKLDTINLLIPKEPENLKKKLQLIIERENQGY